MKPQFEYEITDSIAVLSERGQVSKELNKVSYNGMPAKYDIRSWQRSEGGEKMLKGLTLTDEEASILKAALNKIKEL